MKTRRNTVEKAAQMMLEALSFIVNDTPEPGADAQLTTEGYNRACEAIAAAKEAGLTVKEE